MKSLLLLAVVAAVAAGTTAARAADVAAQSDGTLYFGSGNPNGDFTTSTGSDGSILGLRADYRYGALVAPVGNVYTVTAGGGSLALWDYVYSIDLTHASGGTDPTQGYTATLTITSSNQNSSVTSTSSVFYNPLLIPDNDKTGGGVVIEPVTFPVQQNAENISFPVIGGFDGNIPGTYTIDLTLKNAAGAQIATDEILVNVVPLPSAATMGAGMLGLVAAAAFLRKKFQTA